MTSAHRPLPPDALRLLTADPGRWLSCDDCFRLVDRYVDALLAGGAEPAGGTELASGTQPAAAELAAMPAHLSGCSACAEEATTLLLLAATDRGVDPGTALPGLSDA